ncbi:MAG TPA: RNA polymerase sigma factor RpoD/SigA [Terriglobia bacterium]|jgi:RNA polymerase primary sigma factor|nr:RNA polymerase sigma factor RpoD/SigA [Terriglobia bacterium]
MKTIPYERVVEGPDTLRLYLKEISRFAQLTPEEEKELGARAQKGDEEAFQKLIEANLRFVVAMAKKYARSGYPLHELINEGNLGLIEAVSRFDPGRGVRFITYASWWIRQAILAAIAHHGQVFRLPPKLKHELYRFDSKVARLTQELGHRPSVDEISKGLGMEEQDVREMMEGTPTEVSLDTPIGEGAEMRLEELIQDQSVTPVDELLIARSFEEQLQALLSQLDDKERVIIERRFGLGDREPQTLAEIGSDMKLSRERIRQIEERALGKLRRSQRAKQLLGYLN